jgi:hypothetical protein
VGDGYFGHVFTEVNPGILSDDFKRTSTPRREQGLSGVLSLLRTNRLIKGLMKCPLLRETELINTIKSVLQSSNSATGLTELLLAYLE